MILDLVGQKDRRKWVTEVLVWWNGVPILKCRPWPWTWIYIHSNCLFAISLIVNRIENNQFHLEVWIEGLAGRLRCVEIGAASSSTKNAANGWAEDIWRSVFANERYQTAAAVIDACILERNQQYGSNLKRFDLYRCGAHLFYVPTPSRSSSPFEIMLDCIVSYHSRSLIASLVERKPCQQFLISSWLRRK